MRLREFLRISLLQFHLSLSTSAVACVIECVELTTRIFKATNFITCHSVPYSNLRHQGTRRVFIDKR